MDSWITAVAAAIRQDDARPPARPDDLPAPTRCIRIVSCNLARHNPSVGATLERLLATRADLLLLQEVTGPHLCAVAERMQIGWTVVAHPRRDFHGVALLTRTPVLDSGISLVAGTSAAWVDLPLPPGTPRVRVVCVHAPAPIAPGPWRCWKEFFAAVEQMMRNRTSPIIVAGDFNATVRHADLARLLDVAGAAGSHLRAGPTWPARRPLLEVDHVIHTPELRCEFAARLVVSGSDHLALVADFGR